VATLPSFREAWKRGNRCALVASGYVESITVNGRKAPQLVQVDGGRPFAMAGIWTDWPGQPDHTPSGQRIRAMFSGEIRTCAILTTTPNEVARQVHHRMPVLLDASDTDRWLGCAPDEAATMLREFDSFRMGFRPVNHIINKSGVDAPECLDPPSLP
jgi:putative SOS response-associated peptidase YedK